MKTFKLVSCLSVLIAVGYSGLSGVLFAQTDPEKGGIVASEEQTGPEIWAKTRAAYRALATYKHTLTIKYKDGMVFTASLQFSRTREKARLRIVADLVDLEFKTRSFSAAMFVLDGRVTGWTEDDPARRPAAAAWIGMIEFFNANGDLITELLLEGKENPFRPESLDAPRLVGSENIDGEEVYRLAFQKSGAESLGITMWIAKKTMMVRRYQYAPVDGGDREVVLVRPEPNGAVDEDAFDLDSKKNKSLK